MNMGILYIHTLELKIDGLSHCIQDLFATSS